MLYYNHNWIWKDRSLDNEIKLANGSELIRYGQDGYWMGHRNVQEEFDERECGKMSNKTVLEDTTISFLTLSGPFTNSLFQRTITNGLFGTS